MKEKSHRVVIFYVCVAAPVSYHRYRYYISMVGYGRRNTHTHTHTHPTYCDVCLHILKGNDVTVCGNFSAFTNGNLVTANGRIIGCSHRELLSIQDPYNTVWR